MLAIINAELVMKDHYIPDAYILLKRGLYFLQSQNKEVKKLWQHVN